jgi:hypothetical protein
MLEGACTQDNTKTSLDVTYALGVPLSGDFACGCCTEKK